MGIFDKIKNIIISIVVFAALVFAWLVYSDYDKNNKQGGYTFPDYQEPAFSFECLGKVNCSEMSSCEEAKYYMLNCPGTRLDPDGDGIPCEQSLCAND